MNDFELKNTTKTVKWVSIEPIAYQIELLPETEYRLLTREDNFTIEFFSDSQIIIYLNFGRGLEVFKRQIVGDAGSPNDWKREITITG